MKVDFNGIIRDETPEEIAEREAEAAQQEREYWQTISYEDAVNIEIRKRYSESAEFAILRQKDEKPEEYAEYFAYCEECKRYVQDKFKECNRKER